MAKVLVAMSGGVDSSVTALLLRERGYEVLGVTMRLFCYGEDQFTAKSCCSLEAVNDAKAVAAKIGIPHYVVNYEKEFEREVVDNFVKEYAQGHTPNPCVRCNSVIKFDYLFKKADELGCDFLATGHYARVSGGSLLKGLDNAKDQTYFLYGIPKKNLDRVLFPVGEMTKPEVRRIAEENGLVTAKKPESQEICFIPDNDYPGFLKKRLDLVRVQPGPILTKDGREVGRHSGLPFYTVGQRRGLQISGTEPWYVLSVDLSRNALVVGKDEDLFEREVVVGGINWLEDAPESFEASAKVRYNMAEKKGRAQREGDRLIFVFEEPVRAVTPGQSFVLYDGEKVLGGGIIL